MARTRCRVKCALNALGAAAAVMCALALLGGTAAGAVSNRSAKPPKAEHPAHPDHPSTPGKPTTPTPEPDPVTPPALPGAATGVSCVSGDMADVITFGAPADGGTPDAYVLSAALRPEGPFSEVATVSAAERSFTVTVTAPAYVYYAVTARNVTGAGTASQPVSNTHVAMTAVVGPLGATLRSSNGEVVLVLPEGAFDTSTTVDVREISGSPTGGIVSLAGVYEITPSGTLGAPARLSVAYTLAVTHTQVSDTLLRAAGLMTYDEGARAWVAGATDVRAEGGFISGTLSHFSYWTGATIQPHGTTGTAVNYCTGVCHDLATYPGSTTRYNSRDPQICYNCHGNVDPAAAPAGAPGENVQGSITGVASISKHPVVLGGLYCTVCHDPHANPASAPGLLKAWDPVTGRSVASGGGTTPGEEYCWTCHGSVNNRRTNYLVSNYYASTGGDKKTAFAGSAHAGVVSPIAAISCTACHAEHGSPYESLVATVVAGQTVTGSDNSVCLACHAVATRTYPGSATYQLSAHGRHTQPDREVCTSCHDPHGKPGISTYLNAAEEDDCYACHDGSEGLGCNGCHTPASVRPTPNIKAELAKRVGAGISWQRMDVWSNATANPAQQVKAADVDGDTDDDIVSVWADRTIRWYGNSGDATTWTPVLVGTAPADVRSLDVGDLEGDGDVDILVGCMDGSSTGGTRNGYVRVYVNTSGDGTAWTVRTVKTLNATYSSYGYTCASFGDFDRDGDLDVASGWWTKQVRWHANTAGDGSTWTDTVVGGTASEAYRLEVGELTGDGTPDILCGTETGLVYLFKNVGNGASWTSSTVPVAADTVHDLAVGDIDGDGDNDIIGQGWADTLRLAKNNGTGTVWTTSVLPYYWSLDYVSADLLDMDGDGDLDIAATIAMSGDDDRVVYQYLNTRGDGTAWGTSYAFVGAAGDYTTYYDLGHADFDRDGDQDLCFGGRLTGVGRKMFILKNNGYSNGASGAHPVDSVSGRHRVDESSSDVGAGNRHAECADCHAPHVTKMTTHTMGNPALAGVLEGVRGVSAAYATAGTAPTYAELGAITQEYQLCFRCHSSYTSGYTGEDKGQAFNPLNAGTHPVVAAGANLGVQDSAFTLGTPWNPTAGDDADYSAASPRLACTDCHNNDDAAGPRGPHGSTNSKILRAKVSTDPLSFGGNQNEECLVCHDPATYNTIDSNFPTFAKPAGYASRVYHRHFIAWGAYCLECHVEHGSDTPHMLKAGYATHSASGGTWVNFSPCGINCHGGTPPYLNPMPWTNDY